MSKETIYIEIDGAAGGEEGNLFAAELCRAYEMWARRNGLQAVVQQTLPSIIQICGENAHTYFEWEGGVPPGRVRMTTMTRLACWMSRFHPG